MVFSVLIGVLGPVFKELVPGKYADVPDEDADVDPAVDRYRSSGFQAAYYRFGNGIGSKINTSFEILIYSLIGATVVIGVL